VSQGGHRFLGTRPDCGSVGRLPSVNLNSRSSQTEVTAGASFRGDFQDREALGSKVAVPLA